MSGAAPVGPVAKAYLCELVATIEEAWAKGLAVCFATDGSYVLDCRLQDGALEWRANVSSSWIWGIMRTDSVLDPNAIDWQDAALHFAGLPDGAKVAESAFHDRVPSNWDGELFGIIGALRFLRRLPWTTARRGRVDIWTDSQAIEKVLERVKTEKDWRKLTCTQAWQDIRAMIEEWAELDGGCIQTMWTASHAERRTSNRQLWSSVELGNDLADKAALRARLQVIQTIEGDDRAQLKKGGIWSYQQNNLTFVRIDGPLSATWKRQAGLHHLQKMNSTRKYEDNRVDIRPLLWAEAAYLPLPFAFFRNQLLYGQLPSARVWYRNHKVFGPESEICSLCQKQGKDKVDIWHILSECSSPDLVIIRARHAAEVHRSIATNFLKWPNLQAALRLEFKISDASNGPCRLLSTGVSADRDESGEWMHCDLPAKAGSGSSDFPDTDPDDWPKRGEIGPQPSPWFGIFPKRWMEIGAQCAGVQEGSWRPDLGKEVNAMQRALAGLAKLTIAGCRTTWQGAGGLWAEVNRRDQIFLQQSHRTAIILELRREAVDREVRGAQAMWRVREARAARRARAEEGAEAAAVAAGAVFAAGLRPGRGRRKAKIFPLEWVPAQWRAYARQQTAAAALRCRPKKPILGQNLKPARQQSIAEVMAARDRAKGSAARPILFDSHIDSRGAKRPARDMKLLQNLLKRPKNGVG
jgi:hypothetical protein